MKYMKCRLALCALWLAVVVAITVFFNVATDGAEPTRLPPRPAVVDKLPPHRLPPGVVEVEVTVEVVESAPTKPAVVCTDGKCSVRQPAPKPKTLANRWRAFWRSLRGRK